MLAYLPEDIVCNLAIDDVEDYDTLKKNIIENLSANKHQLIEEALRTLSLGDKKPSLFVNELKRKFSEVGLAPDDTIMKSRLLSALSPSIKSALVGHDGESLESFVRIADSMVAIVSQQSSVFNIGVIENKREESNF